MTENRAERTEALRVMLKYLEDRYRDQVAALRGVDSKVNVRLTIYGGLVGLVTLTMPALAQANVSTPWLFAGGIVLGIFAVCLFRALWLALRVLEVTMHLPGIAPGSFEKMAGDKELALQTVLQELVINYEQAVLNNRKLASKRNVSAKVFKKWSKATVATGFLVLAFFAIVYVASAQTARVERPQEKIVTAKEPEPKKPAESKPAPSEPPQPTAEVAPEKPAAEVKPSLLAPPDEINLGEGVDPKRQTTGLEFKDLKKKGEKKPD